MTALLQEEPAVRQAYDKYLKFNSDVRMRTLDSWIAQAAVCQSLDDFAAALK